MPAAKKLIIASNTTPFVRPLTRSNVYTALSIHLRLFVSLMEQQVAIIQLPATKRTAASTAVIMIAAREANKRLFQGTSAGPIVMQFTRQWSPIGYNRELLNAPHHSHFFPLPDSSRALRHCQRHKDLQSMAATVEDDPQQDPPIKSDTGIITLQPNIG
jgi:hypothetical protein